MQPIIYFASDHAGFALKNELLEFVKNTLGFDIVDCGAYVVDENDDFTDFVSKAAREVSADPENTKAIILGGSGQGEAMLANRFHDVRAVVYYGGPEEIVSLSRVHNDANILSLGARFIDGNLAKKVVEKWLYTEHAKVEKYDRRIDEIELFSNIDDERGNTRTVTLVPSLPASSFEEILHLGEELEGIAQGIQIDIVDGVFVPYISWPFTENNIFDELQKLAYYTKKFEVEIDCMCMNPELYLDIFVSLRIQRVIIHVGSTEKYQECFEHAKKFKYKIGLAITNSTDTVLVDTYINTVDFVQVMGIENIGVQGQTFDTRTIDTVATLRAKYPNLEIAVDGSVNETTITQLHTAGANRFAPGSAITKSNNPKLAYKQLSGMIGL
jgi:ribose 5-phosphate isomerase B